MLLFNTLSGRKEQFVSGPEVSVYVCGITPYDTTHLGHAFLYVFFDVLIRHLESKGYRVTYTQNVTDIDDDILRKAAELHMDYRELAQRETAQFVRDLEALNVRMPDHFPWATGEIAQMVEIVEALLHKGHAYQRDGSVYFDISTYPRYGELSRCSRDEMIELARERGGNPEDPLRDDPLDFLLWQAANPGEPAWPSPWGPGRPGWHIECTEMSLRYLGHPVTIHGGGADLVFPHHESERAQSECYMGEQPFVRYWVHTAMLEYLGEKMSKSLGNLVLVSELLKTHTPDAVRLALLSHHYRRPWEFTEPVMTEAQALSDRLARAAALSSGSSGSVESADLAGRFWAALDDDLDTPSAIAALRELSGRIEAGGEAGKDITEAQEELRGLGAVLGLTLGKRRSAEPEPA